MGREELLETIVERVKRKNNHVRLVEGQLFIREESMNYISRLYYESTRGETPSREQSRETEVEIIKMTISGLQYLSDEKTGKQCWSGRCIPLDDTTTRTLETIIPVTTTQPIPCKDYLHPKDPYFKNRNDIELCPSERYTARIDIKGKKYLLPVTVFESFVEQARTSRPTRKMFNSRLATRRKCLTTLTILLSSLRRIRKKTEFHKIKI